MLLFRQPNDNPTPDAHTVRRSQLERLGVSHICPFSLAERARAQVGRHACSRYTGVTQPTLGLVILAGMNQEKDLKVGAVFTPAPVARRGFNAQRGLPLPQRWRRAKAWASRTDLPQLDAEELKVMRALELRGRG